MTLSEQVSDLRARKQTPDGPAAQRASSNIVSERPPLRLVPAATQVAEPPQPPTDDHSPSTVLDDLEDALTGHTITATHPPTLVDAATNLWPARDEVRHGFAGQVGSALAGLVQLAGLAVCWATAHVFFATKTRAAIFALVLVATFSALAIALNA